MERAHERISVGLGDTAGGGDGGRDGVAANNRLLRKTTIFELDGVYQ